VSDDERAALALMDGERTLSEIAAATTQGELRVYQLAYAAIVLSVALPRSAGDQLLHAGDRDVGGARRRDATIDRQRVAAKHAQVRNGDYFALLGLGRDASAHEVLRAYERARREFSPETIGRELADELSAELAEIREVVEEAREILLDDELRTAYCQGIES
jgi:hypothetical protein